MAESGIWSQITEHLDAMDSQLKCSDQYADDVRPDDRAVWKIQNDHIRDLIADLRRLIS